MAFIAQSQRTPPAPASDGTAAALPLRKLSFPALGTTCEVQYAAPSGDAQAAGFERAVTSWVNAFETKYSRFRPESLVSRINAAAGREWVEVDAEMDGMLKLCDTLHFMTQGILDPTTMPLIRLWNYKAETPRIPAEAEIAAARALVGWKKVQRAPGKIFLPEPGMALDFGGFGKEYAVDLAARIALDHGIPHALVDFGHDLRAVGAPPGRPAWHIGLEDPLKPGTSAGSMAIVGKGVASSGDYIRRFVVDGKRYGHIIDPRTGWPVTNGCLQATVVAATCLQAGVLSTTAFVLGVPKGIEFIQAAPGAEGLLVAEKSRAQTRGFFNYVVS
ncbi:FAD:protein FMN transferase [Horticoccus sp. 23ND18S-11]|uniref:FAD:protein FMN transferase n=1 Tax=Horticoccus sp. 23ND18S-11 TaxID=3391832 RepID=UPI0039C902E7